MNDDIIRMAREAGLHRQQHNLLSNPPQYRFSYEGYEEALARFAALVRADEREACAKLCEEWADALDRHKWPTPYHCADAIRARSKA